MARHPLQIWSKSSSTEASPVSRNPGWLLRAQTWPCTCTLVCAAHTFILAFLIKTLSKRNQESPQSMWPIYITFTLNTARTNPPTPTPAGVSRRLASAFAPPSGQFHLQQTGDGRTEPGCWTPPRAEGEDRGGGGERGRGAACASTSSADPPPSAESCSPVSAARSRPRCHPGPCSTGRSPPSASR